MSDARTSDLVPGVHVLTGDCLAMLPTLADESVHALVTDPPAGIGFMGKDWDHNRGGRNAWVTWMTAVMVECLRVCKPGSHALVWALPRTSHWTATAMEDAGWEIRDVIVHLFGQGFPKSLNVSKAIDAVAGAERPVIGQERMKRIASPVGQPNSGYAVRQPQIMHSHTGPATLEAEQWDGWGTALKPASEHWILARKPLPGIVAANVLEHGTGALNINGCRVGTNVNTVRRNSADMGYHGELINDAYTTGTDKGRWPANVVLDEESAALLDEQSGTLTSGANPTRRSAAKTKNVFARFDGQEKCAPARSVDRGGASRFFYVAKASRSERGEDNNHPTVKSLALMRWLVRLVTPPSGIVLDPFAGSGSTLVAALQEEFNAIGIEQDPIYVEIIQRRLADARLPLFEEHAS